MEIDVCNEKIELLWQKAIFWKREGLLVVADLHLGKVNHFRKAGIPVPLKADFKNLEHLTSLIIQRKPQRVLFLGDLFHSHYNSAWESIKQLIFSYQHISFELVPGNHDILSVNSYIRSGLQLHPEKFEHGPFVFTHHPLDTVPDNRYNIAGHVHPGIQLTGRGRQSVVLPCFYFSEQYACLPAFGSFTGLYRICPKKSDRLFAVVDEKIIKV
ncbi:MAG: ligase-associated DNA damage response endonuclease PdeM [Flammeovirgaceae bacterium]|nr:MAG: ligase-associated DNA damage response endonuclease PdeM [Flammeovirgaceae bacterium]